MTLDGRPIKTPAGKPLLVPNIKLAQAVADEWQEQGKTIRVNTMPLMQMAATTLDHVPIQRIQMQERLMAYIGTDVVCHRVLEPQRLRDMQEKLFAPALSWLHRRFDIDLQTTTELLAVDQPLAAQQRLSSVLAAIDDWALMGVQTAALASGSIVLAMGMLENEFTAQEVFDASEVEGTFQIEKWGVDSEIEIRRNTLAAELTAVEQWFALIK